MSTRIFAAYNAYLAVIKTALPDMDAAGAVFDGPQPKYATNIDFVVVGCADPLADGMVLAVDSGQQEWITLGPQRPRDETFVIYSTLITWTGDNDLPGCRARADAGLSAIEAGVRADLTLGGALTNPGWCGIAVTQMGHTQYTSGTALHAQFALACRARI